MTDAIDARVTDALHALSGKERRHMTHAPFRTSFDAIADELREDENVDKLCGAISASLGRGVLALAGDRLVFHGARVGGSSWAFADIIDVDVRRGAFTLSSAVTLHVKGGKHVFALTCGRRPAAEFAEAVQSAVRHSETVSRSRKTAA
jgi:hypothetical protein